MVGGTGFFGCGIPSQLESWYRFLVQPDPYQSIVVSNGRASWSGVDTTILQQRHDFLRPDSMVIVVVVSNRNDSEIDVRSLGGAAYNFMSTTFDPPNATSACESSPASASCKSCTQQGNVTTDPACATKPSYTALNDWGYDMRLRSVHMKAKYGVDAQYPIDRYVLGLSSLKVPDRSGEYPPGAGSYVGTPHMIESYQPRAGLAAPGSANNADPTSGHEWITDTSNGTPGSGMSLGGGHVLPVDLEYACIYPLYDANGNPVTRDCSLAQNEYSCACPHEAGTLAADELPAVCDPTTITKQVGARAYPSIRELEVAHGMGSQGLVASICPINGQDNATGDDPLYGYRPAIAVIVDRLKPALTNTCLPEPLPVGKDGTVPCSVTLQVPSSTQGTTSALLPQLTPQRNPGDFQGGTCAVAQNDKGWCYVTGVAAGKCSQAIVLAGTQSEPPGATVTVQCAK
jgi:hypothetical protein